MMMKSDLINSMQVLAVVTSEPRLENRRIPLVDLFRRAKKRGDFLTKANKDSLLEKFEVKRRSPGRTGKKKKRFQFLRNINRKKKFSLAWALGYILSPFLLTPIGGAIAGWTGVFCLGAELVPWVEKKLKFNALDDADELLEWLVESLRDNDFLKAFLFGFFVGGDIIVTCRNISYFSARQRPPVQIIIFRGGELIKLKIPAGRQQRVEATSSDTDLGR